MRRALATRTDLEQARRQLAVQRHHAPEPDRPAAAALDLTASYGAGRASAGRSSSARAGSSAAPSRRSFPSGYADALANPRAIATRPTWNFALNLSYPIGASPAEANLARARLQQRQTIAQTRAARAADCHRGHQRGAAGRSQRASACRRRSAARELAERRLEAEQSRFEVGLSTNFFVVQAQRDLRDAQNAELRALLDYRRAQVDFERVQEIAGRAAAAASPASRPAAAGAARQRRRWRRFGNWRSGVR